MQAVNLKNARKLVIEDAPMPQIGEDEVLVKVSACGICGIDLVGDEKIDVNPVISGSVTQDELTDAFERLCAPNDEVKLVLEMG